MPEYFLNNVNYHYIDYSLPVLHRRTDVDRKYWPDQPPAVETVQKTTNKEGLSGG